MCCIYLKLKQYIDINILVYTAHFIIKQIVFIIG